MFWLQVGVIFCLLIGFSIILAGIFKKFGLKAKFVLPLLIPLFVFSLGFCLRLSEKYGMVDLGFFLTDFSELFLTALFIAFLFLGQLRYWKK